MQFRFVVAGMLLAIAIIIGLGYWRASDLARSQEAANLRETRSPAKPSEPAAPAPRPAPQPSWAEPEVLEPSVALPPLNASDSWLREEVEPDAASFLATLLGESELVRTFAAVLENASRGEYPRNLLGFMTPSGKFMVHRVAGKMAIDPASYARYDAYVQALGAVSPARAATIFLQFEPLLFEALREFGEGPRAPRSLLADALTRIYAIPLSADPVTLVRPKVLYKFADAELEALSPMQKQLLRMGPANLQIIRDWLDQFADQLAVQLAT